MAPQRNECLLGTRTRKNKMLLVVLFKSRTPSRTASGEQGPPLSQHSSAASPGDAQLLLPVTAVPFPLPHHPTIVTTVHKPQLQDSSTQPSHPMSACYHASGWAVLCYKCHAAQTTIRIRCLGETSTEEVSEQSWRSLQWDFSRLSYKDPQKGNLPAQHTEGSISLPVSCCAAGWDGSSAGEGWNSAHHCSAPRRALIRNAPCCLSALSHLQDSCACKQAAECTIHAVLSTAVHELLLWFPLGTCPQGTTTGRLCVHRQLPALRRTFVKECLNKCTYRYLSHICSSNGIGIISSWKHKHCGSQHPDPQRNTQLQTVSKSSSSLWPCHCPVMKNLMWLQAAMRPSLREVKSYCREAQRGTWLPPVF